MSDETISRRSMLGRSAAGAVLATVPAWYAQQAQAADNDANPDRDKKHDANSQIQIACIGCGGSSKGSFRQGLGDTRGIGSKKGVKVVGICDVEKIHREEAARSFGPDCKQYTDFRELLRDKTIDAVVIGTPDHWHSYIAIAALRAGKDVYCEKPLTLFIEEGQHVVKAQHKTGRVFQTGSQQRSDTRFRMACEMVRNGRIGKVKRVEARLPDGTKGGPFDVLPAPEGLDWDMWLGPTYQTEYIKERTHGSFRNWYEYSGGMMTDWGAHHLDISQWGLGKDGSGPIAVEGKGTLPAVPRGYNVAYGFEVTYTYPNDIKLIAMSSGENGVRFEGEDGWIFVSRSRIEASDEKILNSPLSANAERLYVSENHHQNFVDCIRSRKETICPAAVGHRSASVCHMGNISMRMGGRQLKWDPVKEEFIGDDEANKMLSRPYRAPWKLG